MHSVENSPDLAARTLPGAVQAAARVPRRQNSVSTRADEPLSPVAVAAMEEEFDPALDGADDDGDKTLYCFCQRVSFGEMIACDAPDCEHEWVRLQALCPNCCLPGCQSGPDPVRANSRFGGRSHRRTRDRAGPLITQMADTVGQTSQFHLPCVGLKSIPDGRWFCDECRVRLPSRIRRPSPFTLTVR